METRAHYVAVGAFVLTAIFLAFVAVLWLGRTEFAEQAKRYYIFFRGSVAGLNKGSQVQYNGIPSAGSSISESIRMIWKRFK